MRLMTDQQLALKRWLNHEYNQFVLNQPILYLDPPVIIHDHDYSTEFHELVTKLTSNK